MQRLKGSYEVSLSMKKAIAIVVLGLLLSGNAYPKAFDVKFREKNEYGAIIFVKLAVSGSPYIKWSKSLEKSRNMATDHCKSLNKKTYAFWSKNFDYFARDKNGGLYLMANGHELADEVNGMVQEWYWRMTRAYFRFYCATTHEEAYDLLWKDDELFKKKYKTRLNFGKGKLFYSEISSNPFDFKTLFEKKEKKKKKIVEKPKKEKPKKKKPKQSPDDNKVVAFASGSGFFVSNTGHIVTNHHVIDECKAVKVNFKGNEIEAKVLAEDKTNDLAILQANITPGKVYSVSNEDVTLLQDIIVAGFPLGKRVSAAIKTHKGSVSALAGFGDNYSNFQTDATINQGNSGGPVMDQKGNVVGVAVALMPVESGQNIFFAVKSSTLKTFAISNGLSFLPPNIRPMSNKDLGQLITEGTVFLECWMTIAKIKQIIAQEENRRAFYSEFK